MRKLLALFPFFGLLACSAHAATYFIAPDGLDTNPGSLARPFASITRAQEAVAPGDTVFFRGGTYRIRADQVASEERFWDYVFPITKSGTAQAPIEYRAYDKEAPVLDFSAVKPEGHRVIAFYVTASWVHFEGLEVIGVQVTLKNHTQSECFENHGSHNLYERLSMHDGQAIGFYLLNGSDNLVLNCDAFRNWDYTSEDGRGGNTDGFGCHPAKGATGNVFRGCRSWFNSDDGYDCISSYEAVTFDHCWSMYNGLNAEQKDLGDGNGFKAGGYGSRTIDRLPNVIPVHVVRFCLAVGNKASGFYANHHLVGIEWLNNSAYGNHIDFNMLERLPDNRTDIPGPGQHLHNNLAYKGGKILANLDAAHSDLVNNTFDTPPIALTDADFLSLDEKQLTTPRQPDGSLPVITFLHLIPGSFLARKSIGAFAADPGVNTLSAHP
jgi:hypothetical protein